MVQTSFALFEAELETGVFGRLPRGEAICLYRTCSVAAVEHDVSHLDQEIAQAIFGCRVHLMTDPFRRVCPDLSQKRSRLVGPVGLHRIDCKLTNNLALFGQNAGAAGFGSIRFEAFESFKRHSVG